MITKQNKGFTLLEILLVIAAIGILAAIVLVAINPNRQIEAARNAQRRADINTITKAIQQYIIDNNGQYPAGIDTGAKAICQTGNSPTGCVDLSSILVPTYIASIPVSDSNNYYVRRSVAGTSIEVTHPRDSIWNIAGTPSLDLNFASNKSLIDNVSGNNLITFTRNSPIATYVGEDGLIKTAVANEPRFDHNPITGESLGLLIEDARTNLVLNGSSNSAGFETSNTTQMYGIAPNGTKSSVRWNAPNGFTFIRTFFPVTQGVKYTLSIYVKGQSNVRITPDGSLGGGLGYGSIDLSTGITTGYSEGVQVTQYQNGWRRISFQRTASSTGTGQLALLTNNMAVDIEFWGPQIEVGSFPTSYIPTSGSALTRATDVASITGSNFSSWVDISGGTILSAYYKRAPIGGNGNYVWSLGGNAPAFYYTNSGGYFERDFARGLFSSVGPNLSGLNKSAFRFEVGNYAASVNSGAVSTSLDNGSWTTPSSLSLGTGVATAGGARRINGPLSRLTYWPSRLPNQILQTITQ
jgi:prepilin-type N-terminal cleavage/methylation domain-containing protein